MSPEQMDDRQALMTRVTNSLRRAETITSGLRKADARLGVASISSSGGCTLVAGMTAALGPSFGITSVGWRVACIVSALLAFAATVFGGLGQQMKISDRLSNVNQCVGRLRSLDVVITMGARDWKEITQEYAERSHKPSLKSSTDAL